MTTGRRHAKAAGMAAWIAAAAVMPGATAAQPVTGVFDEDCAFLRTHGVSDARLELREGRLIAHEAECTLSNPVAVRDMGGATLYDARCSSEGEASTRRIMIMPSPGGGVVVVGTGYARTLERCGP